MKLEHSDNFGQEVENGSTETGWLKSESQYPIFEDIFPKEAYIIAEKMKDPSELVILDIRPPDRFEEGHVQGAINLNFFSRSFKKRISGLDKDKAYFIYCEMGGASKITLNMMKKLGFREVYNIRGGFILWEDEELPYSQKKQDQPYLMAANI